MQTFKERVIESYNRNRKLEDRIEVKLLNDVFENDNFRGSLCFLKTDYKDLRPFSNLQNLCYIDYFESKNDEPTGKLVVTTVFPNEFLNVPTSFAVTLNQLVLIPKELFDVDWFNVSLKQKCSVNEKHTFHRPINFLSPYVKQVQRDFDSPVPKLKFLLKYKNSILLGITNEHVESLDAKSVTIYTKGNTLYVQSKDRYKLGANGLSEFSIVTLSKDVFDIRNFLFKEKGIHLQSTDIVGLNNEVQFLD